MLVNLSNSLNQVWNTADLSPKPILLIAMLDSFISHIPHSSTTSISTQQKHGLVAYIKAVRETRCIR